MGATTRLFKLAPLFRVWDPARRGFGFSDQRPDDVCVVDAWAGRFDREGRPIYEQDILSVHHDWKLGWVRALVEKRAGTAEFRGVATGPDGPFHIAAYQFADAYVEGNAHQHPEKLLPAVPQFPEPETADLSTWWGEGLRWPRVASTMSVRQNHSSRMLRRLTSEVTSSSLRPESVNSRLSLLAHLQVQPDTRATRRDGSAVR
ncbi:MAG TPA: hypothetical protein VI136_08715 [Verrucomicrobiae bacterium]